MKHYYKIDDSFEIKIVVLYTLYNAKKPLTQNQLTYVIANSADIDYFDLYTSVDALIQSKEMLPFTDSNGAFSYKLTEAGETAAKHFSPRIPLLVREYISQTLDEMFREERKKRQFITEIIPEKDGGYSAHMRISDSDLPLMDLSVYAGGKNVALDIANRFKNNITKIYDGVIHVIMQDYDEKPEGKSEPEVLDNQMEIE